MDDLRARLAAALAGRYTVEREIGRGGMSIVFLAYDPSLERPVAIKVLRPELARSLGPDRFLDEIKVAARLKHPYILKLHEAGDARGLLFYSMPYVEGETLRQRLSRERTLSVADALRVAQEVAEALDHAHRHNVIHRDIKPENILFEEGHAVVSDFGIAKAISEAGDRRTVPGIVLGTLDYMSPEQEQGIQELDGRTDLYSLGLVLYEMLVGQTPGPDSGVDSLTGKRADVPLAVVRLLRTALARDRVNRFPTAADLVSALEALTRGKPARDGRRWGITAAALGGVALALLLWIINKPPVGAALDPTHIAVLYFDDLTPDRSMSAVAAGLTEDLIDRLAQVPVLHVTSPNGVRPYRGQAVVPDSLARALGTGTIVSGSVTRSAGMVRASVRLVDGTSGQVLHTRQVMRPYGELFALQDTITADIATFLRQRIGESVTLRERSAGTSSVEAWEHVRRADGFRDGVRDALRAGDDSTATLLLRRADSLYVRASDVDPRWGVPHSGRGWVAQAFAEFLARARPLAEARRSLSTSVPARPRYEDEWLRAARAHAERAIELGEGAEALELRGLTRYLWWLQGYAVSAESLRASERDLRDAVAESPTRARAWWRLSQLLRLTGRFAEAGDAAARALEADAFLLEARGVYRTLYFAALNLEQYDAARDWCAKAGARFPGDREFAHCELRILGWSGHGRSAIARASWLTDSLDAGPPPDREGVFAADRRLLLSVLCARSGAAERARALLGEARVAAGSDTSAAWFLLAAARVEVLLDHPAAALALIEQTLAAAPQQRDFVTRVSWFNSLHDDTTFARLVGAQR